MQRALTERESGLLSLQGAAAFGHRPAAFAGAALGDAGLARRFAQSAVLPGHSGAVSSLAWTEAGELLASGGEDCRLRLWRGNTGELLHSLDTGHTATILAAAFLPGSRGDQLLCCSADRQIRHIAVTKGAVRPYLVHTGRVRSVTPLDSHVFLSASEDGTVREFDVRQRPVAVHRDALAGDDSNVLVDQRAERVGRSRVRVGIYSLAVDPLRPWLMLTGGADPLLRLYDRRMLPEGDGKAPQWVSAYVPSHIKSAVLDSGRHPALAGGTAGIQTGQAVTSVAFARGGAQLVGSYSGECIYSFDAAQHARDVEALLHIPETVLRGPARPRSHAGRRSMRGLGSSDSVEVGGLLLGEAGTAAAPAAVPPAVPTVAEGAGGTTPAPLGGGRLRQQLQAQQAQRARAARGIAIASSVRQLELQRRQQSRAAAAPEEPPRAESSRPAHWQMRPTSSTLRSPLHELHAAQHVQPGHHHNLRHHAQQQAQQPPPHRDPQYGPQMQQVQQPDLRQAPHELVSDSEGASEGVSPGVPHPRQAVRRSRRIMRRRRGAAEAAEQQQHPEGTAAAGPARDGQQQLEQQQGPPAVQQPAVSGVAEPPSIPPSSSDDDDREPHPPATRGRRVRRRTLAPSAAADAAAAGQPQQSSGAVAVPDVVEATAMGGGDGGFKAPPGRSPQHHRRQAAAAAAAAALQRLDSTLGLLHHHTPQLEASEVAAPQPAQQEATVSMRGVGGQPAGGAQHCAAPADHVLAAEVNSRPLPSASHVELGTQLGSQQAGNEASSLNSAEPPAHERVGSVMQRPQVDAPSVGNAPAATAAAAAGAPGEQQEVQQALPAIETQEASTGHQRGGRASGARPPPPPHFGALPGAEPRQRQHLQPTASTGTSRPPAFGSQVQPGQRYLPPAASGRQASRLRRHSDGLEASQPFEAAAAAGCTGSQAVANCTQCAPADAAERQVGGQPPSAAAQRALSLQQAQPQATMLSGRGPSVLGDFMPGQHEQLADSEIAQQRQQQQGSVGAQRGEPGQPQAAGHLRQGRRRQVDSNVGAIVHSTDADDGEEVSEPTMFHRRYAGHLNLSTAAMHDTLPLTPQLAFLGHHSELLVSPSDCGSLFVWDYASARMVAVLPLHAADASSAGSGGGEQAPAPAATCVAPHPLLPLLASGGADSVVRLWSPEAAEACSRELAAAAVGANLQALAGSLDDDGGGAAEGLAGDPSTLLLPGSPCAFQ